MKMSPNEILRTSIELSLGRKDGEEVGKSSLNGDPKEFPKHESEVRHIEIAR